MTGDMPTIIDSGHAHSTYSLANLAVPTSTWVSGTGLGAAVGLGVWDNQNVALQQRRLIAGNPAHNAQAGALFPATPSKPKEKPVSRRLVQVFIADPDENLPLEQSLLYSGDQKLTDATDQELFFEIDMKSILEKHNAARVTFIDKKVKERTEHLEPVKIRDLRMVVVNVATF
jgi:hypothetical protein